MILKILGYLVLVVTLYKIKELIQHYFIYRELKKQGVAFMGDGGWAFIRDIKFTLAVIKKKPNALS